MAKPTIDSTLKEAVLMHKLAQLVDYFPETGVLSWRLRPRDAFVSDHAFQVWNKRFAGKQIGHRTRKGYWRARLRLEFFWVHRLAFFLHHGYSPEQVDHINRIGSDNRASNLRAATASENCSNRGIATSNTSGVLGVSFNTQSRKWVAFATVAGRHHHAGYFNDIESAKAARAALAARLHGKFASAETSRNA